MGTYFIIAIFILFAMAVIYYFNREMIHENLIPSQKNLANNSQDGNPYYDLREQALLVTPDQLQLSLPENETTVFGIITEQHIPKPDHVMTLICFSTGDASLYYSTGGAIIGGIGSEKVVAAVKDYIDHSQPFVQLSHEATTFPVPKNGATTFYFRTNKGTYYYNGYIEQTSEWYPLFLKATAVLEGLFKMMEETKK